MKRTSGFALIGAFIIVVLGALIVGTVAYICKMMIDKAKTVEANRQRQLTNELVEPFPANFPEFSSWLIDESFEWTVLETGEVVLEPPAEILEDLFDSVAEFQCECSDGLNGPWVALNPLAGTETAVRETLVQMLRAHAATQPFPSIGFIRYTRQ